MLFRKAYNELNLWLKTYKTAILIDGARQVGKTTTVLNFLNKEYSNYVEFNLIRDIQVRDAFDTSINVSQLMLRLTAFANKEVNKDTIFFIDEVQEAADALTKIKFLVQESPNRFIFSGSLLGIKLKNIESVSVGYMSVLRMYPLDFEEFCLALKVNTSTINYLKDCFDNKKPVDEMIHKQMMALFDTYVMIGGMPNAVSTFVETNNLSAVNQKIKDIDQGYLLDISKYDKTDKLNILDIYDLIPSELNHKNKRFVLKNMNENARFSKYDSSFVWLKNSGVGLFTYNVDKAMYPLLMSKERRLFKLFMVDSGLLSYKLFDGNQISILNGDIKVNFGAIYEQVVAQELASHGFPLFYLNSKKMGEVDFLIEKDLKVVPIEVKSGKDYYVHSALNNLISNKNYNINEAYVLCKSNISVKDKIIELPIYMIMFIKKSDAVNQELKLDLSRLL
jgi:predicted AAA+ superfamily ATPase